MQDDSPQAQGEQPVNDDAATGEDINAQLDTMDARELSAALGFDADEDDDAPATDEPTATADDDPQAEEPQPSAQQEEDAHKPINRRRLSVTGLADTDRELAAAAIEMVRKGEAESLPAAIAKLSPKPATATQDPDEEEESPPVEQQAAPEPSPTLADLEARFEDASEELAQSIRDFDQDRQIELQKEISLLNRQILRAEQAEVQHQGQVIDYQGQYQEAVEEMEAKYATELDNEDSAFAEMLDDKIEAARARKDPRLSDPRHIIAFADELATRIGMSAQPPSAATTKPAPSPVSQPPARRPVGSAISPAGNSKPQLTGRQAESLLEKASTADLSKALWG